MNKQKKTIVVYLKPGETLRLRWPNNYIIRLADD